MKWLCLSALLVVGCASSSASPGLAPTPSMSPAPVVIDDAAHDPALAARAPRLLDARTRPEPHPVIPLGSVLTAYVGPRFLTGEEFVPEARVIIADETGRVRALLQQMPSQMPYPVVKLPGALAVAGLHDAHVHLEGIGEEGDSLNLLQVTSPEQLRASLQSYGTAHASDDAWIGRGWDQTRFPDQAFPTADDIDSVTNKLVWLTRVDGHAGLANRALLKRAGITKDTPDPPGGTIMRDRAGNPTGILIDNAMNLAQQALPPVGDEVRRRRLMRGLQICADAGLVAVHDMGMSVATFHQLRTLDAAGQLPVRVFVYLAGHDDESLRVLGSVASTDKVHLMGLKLLVDGALGSRGAALINDYSDAPGQRGLLLMSEQQLEARVQAAHRSGHQVALHAIGDNATHMAIDVLARQHDERIRDRIEHAQVLLEADVPRLYEHRITASMQPTHATSDMRWAQQRVGAQRLRFAYAWQSLWRTGVAMPLGSDAPVERIFPTWGLYAAITRQDQDGMPQAGFMPHERLTQTQALQGFARMAAYAVNEERHMGALTPGMALDLTLFDIDAAAATDAGDARAWLRAKPLGTMVQGTLRMAPQ
jgi:predicted amidohydrolase YtcJ